MYINTILALPSSYLFLPFFYPSLHLTNIPDPSTLHFGQSIFNPFVYWGWGGLVLVWPGQQLMIPISDPCTDMILYISINIYNTRAPDPGCQLWRRQKKKCWWKYRISFTHDSLYSVYVIQYILLLWKITSFTER